MRAGNRARWVTGPKIHPSLSVFTVEGNTCDGGSKATVDEFLTVRIAIKSSETKSVRCHLLRDLLIFCLR